MTRPENTTNQDWIEAKDVDRYWHLHPLQSQAVPNALTVDPASLRRKRIHQAQRSTAAILIRST